jgi:hypothetical protein
MKSKDCDETLSFSFQQSGVIGNSIIVTADNAHDFQKKNSRLSDYEKPIDDGFEIVVQVVGINGTTRDEVRVYARQTSAEIYSIFCYASFKYDRFHLEL